MFVSIWDWFPFTFFALFILVLNGLILVLYQRETSIRQSTTNKLIANQCIGDILKSLLLIPCYCASLFQKIHIEYVLFVFAFCLLIGTFSILMIALEKLALFVHFLGFLFNGRILKTLVLVWALSLLIAFTPTFAVTGLTTENRESISKQYSVFLLVLFMALLASVLFVLVLTVVLGTRSIQKKTDQLSEMRNLNEAVEMQYCINEEKIHVKSMLKILVPLLFALVVSVSPWIHLITLGNKSVSVINDVMLYVFCLNGLFDPILTVAMIEDYQEAMFRCLGGQKFR